MDAVINFATVNWYYLAILALYMVFLLILLFMQRHRRATVSTVFVEHRHNHYVQP